jgi:hypothetical protein
MRTGTIDLTVRTRLAGVSVGSSISAGIGIGITSTGITSIGITRISPRIRRRTRAVTRTSAIGMNRPVSSVLLSTIDGSRLGALYATISVTDGLMSHQYIALAARSVVANLALMVSATRFRVIDLVNCAPIIVVSPFIRSSIQAHSMPPSLRICPFHRSPIRPTSVFINRLLGTGSIQSATA